MKITEEQFENLVIEWRGEFGYNYENCCYVSSKTNGRSLLSRLITGKIRTMQIHKITGE